MNSWQHENDLLNKITRPRIEQEIDRGGWRRILGRQLVDNREWHRQQLLKHLDQCLESLNLQRMDTEGEDDLQTALSYQLTDDEMKCVVGLMVTPHPMDGTPREVVMQVTMLREVAQLLQRPVRVISPAEEEEDVHIEPDACSPGARDILVLMASKYCADCKCRSRSPSLER